MSEPAPAPSPAPAPAPAPAPSNDPWFQGADADIIGHIQSKGWTNKEPKEVALEAIKAAREAQKHIGIPADQLLRMPKDASDEANWKILRGKLGVPNDAKEYDFSAVKFADGTPLDEKFTEFMRGVAAKSYLPKDAALQVTQEFSKYLDSAAIEEKAVADAKLIEEKKALATNWGANMAANMFVAQQGAKILGLLPEDISALEGVVGYSKVMEAMRRVGVLNKEDAFVAGSGSTSGGVMTREQAIARMDELKSDRVFTEKLYKGDAEANRQWKALQTIRAGV